MLKILAGNLGFLKYAAVIAVGIYALYAFGSSALATWHTEPLIAFEKKVTSLKLDVSNLKVEILKAKEEKKKVLLECEQKGINDVLQTDLKELENEKNITIKTNVGSHVIVFD